MRVISQIAIYLVILTGLTVSPASAALATPFSDNFQSLTTPDRPTTYWRYIGSNSAASGMDSTSFGIATNYAVLSGANRSLFTQDFSPRPVVTITSFDFYDASTNDSADGMNIGWVISGGDLNGSGASIAFKLIQNGADPFTGKIISTANTTFLGTAPIYTRGVKHSLQIIYNSGSTHTSYFFNASCALAAESADVYLDGVLVATFTSTSTGANKTPTSFGFRHFSMDNTANIRIDNFSVAAAAAPPPLLVTVFSDNFQGITVPDRPSTANWRYLGSNLATSSSDSTSFGSATTYAVLSGVNRSLFTKDIVGIPEVTFISFDFFDASTNDSADGTNLGWVTSGGDLNGTGAAFALKLTQNGADPSTGKIVVGPNTTFSGSMPTYSRGVKHNLQIVYNSGSATATFFADTLTAESADVYLDGTYVGTYLSNATGAGLTPTSFGFRNFSPDNAANMRIDNLTIGIQAAPPPPAQTVQMSDDFQSLTVPNRPSSTYWRYIGSNSASSGTDSATFGFTTTYAVLSGANRSLFTRNISGMPVVSLTSFDFLDASTNDPSDGTNIGWVVSSGDLNGTGAAIAFKLIQNGTDPTTGIIVNAANTTFFSGSLPLYTRGARHNLQVVYNPGATSATYFLGTSRKVAAESADVFLDNVYVATYISTSTGVSKIPASFGFRHFSGDNAANIRIDNFSVATIDASSVASVPGPYKVWAPAPGFIKPNIVLQYNAATNTGVNWNAVKEANYDSSGINFAVRDAVEYLTEGLQEMTGQSYSVINSADMNGATGIILTTLSAAPASIQSDLSVIAALGDTGGTNYGGETNEAYYIRSEANRLIIVANRLEGLVCAVPELMESVNYETLGRGPHWTYAPNYTAGLTFNIDKGTRPGFAFRSIWASSGQGGGQGTISEDTSYTFKAGEEPVEKSGKHWTVGRRMRTNSALPNFGHAMQSYRGAVMDHIRATGNPEGFLSPVLGMGLSSARPAASSTNAGKYWLNTDNTDIYYSDGITWTLKTSLGGSLDVSVPAVRNIVFESMKGNANSAFTTAPDDIYGFATDPEDGSGYSKIGLAKYPTWYPQYRSAVGQNWSSYVLNGFKNLNQPTETWDPLSQSDFVFGFNNWLLREYDKYIDSLPTGNDDLTVSPPIYRRNTSTGKSKKNLIRTDCYSYNFHDVPPNFNLDTRMRVAIAGFPKHRGSGKWIFYKSEKDMAEAFARLLPNSFSSLRWIVSYAGGNDFSIKNSIVWSPGAAGTARTLRDYYATTNVRALSAESDLNFGKYGPKYYMISKVMWNPQMTDADIDAAIERWLERSFGTAALPKMREYYNLAWNCTSPVLMQNVWGGCVRKLEEADALVPDGTPEQQRLDDLKTHWYHYYFVDTNQFDENPTEAIREFIWKAQMGYQVALRFDAREDSISIYPVTAVGDAYAAANPANYTPAETAVWWQTVLNQWPHIPITLFGSGTLIDGTPHSQVDMNDLVAIQEFGTDPAPYSISFNSTAQVITTTAHTPGQEVGFKIFWPGGTTPSSRTMFWGMSRYNTVTKKWEDIIDKSMNYSQPYRVATTQTTSGFREVQEVRAVAPTPGTYKIDSGKCGVDGAVISDLNWDVANNVPGTFGGTMTYDYTFFNATGSDKYYYFYIPKNTTTLEFNSPLGRGGRDIRIYSGPSPTSPISRIITSNDAGEPIYIAGIHKVTLLPNEQGVLARISKPNVPSFYSVPMLWAKTPAQLLVPRKIAEADGLTILP